MWYIVYNSPLLKNLKLFISVPKFSFFKK